MTRVRWLMWHWLHPMNESRTDCIPWPSPASDLMFEWAMSHIWMSHVTHRFRLVMLDEWVTNRSHSMTQPSTWSESCHTWMRHVTHECVTLHMNAACHTWMRHVTRMNESCDTYEWVMSHVRMSHVTRMNESCHTYEWVMWHIWMSHVTHVNESIALSHTLHIPMQLRMSHFTRMNESCRTCECVIQMYQ